MTDSNALLITVDSLRADHVSGMGYDRATTPTIDSLAADGLSFSEAIANGSATRSSFPSILTSTYPFMYGGYSYLINERPFIARTLKQAGFRTAAFHSNPHVGADQNYDTGFESFADTAEGSDNIATLKDRIERRLDSNSLLYRFLRRAYHLFSAKANSSAYARAETINQNVRDWFETEWNPGDRFFIWVHYMDVHYPLMPPEEFMCEFGSAPISDQRVVDLNGRMQEEPGSLTENDIEDLKRLYDAEIRYTDYHISQLLNYLKKQGLRDDTAIILCSDHGEAFGEHDRFGHHPGLYDELLRIPLVVNAPSVESAIDNTQVSLLDIGPTLYDLVGVEEPDAIQGESLLETHNSERVAISTSLGGEHFATRTPSWKCFWRRNVDEIELYDLEADPGETADISGNNPDTVYRFKSIIEEHISEANQTEHSLPEIEQSEDVKQRLRSLGYTE